MDVAVMRGAECNTDHRMVRMKMILGRKRAFRREPANVGVKRWDAGKLQGGCRDAKGRETARGKYLNGLRERLGESWVVEGSVSENWDVLKVALCDEAEAVLGYEDRRQPDWFRESGTSLRPLLVERNRLHSLWLSTGRERDRRKHTEARGSVRREVRAAKDAWFQRKAAEAEIGRHEGTETSSPDEEGCCEGRGWQCVFIPRVTAAEVEKAFPEDSEHPE